VSMADKYRQKDDAVITEGGYNQSFVLVDHTR